MDGRPLSDIERKTLFQKNVPRNDEWSVATELILKLMLCAGLREIEIAQLMISDLIAPDGTLSELIILDESRSFNGRERPILLSNDSLKDAIERYLSLLKREEILTAPHKSYFGFCPTALLILHPKTLKSFGIQKRGKRGNGEVKYVPATLNEFIDTAIYNANLDKVGINRRSLIRTFVIAAYKADFTVGEICIVSGLSQSTIEKTLGYDLDQYAPIVSWWKSREKRKEQRVSRMKQVRRWTYGD